MELKSVAGLLNVSCRRFTVFFVNMEHIQKDIRHINLLSFFELTSNSEHIFSLHQIHSFTPSFLTISCYRTYKFWSQNFSCHLKVP